MRRKSRQTLRGRGFRLLVGALCATVVVAMAAGCVVSLLTIGRATQQSSQAIDSAIKAYDLYQQEREPPSGALEDAIADLDAEGDLTALGHDPNNRELRDQVARRIAPLEGVEPDVIDALYVWLQDAADDTGEEGPSGFFLGSGGADIDARAYEERIDLKQLDRLADYGRPVGRLGGDGSASWNVFVSEYRPGVVIVSFSIMPEVPHLEVLEPIADISEMYFVDPDGARYAFGRGEYADAIDLSPLSDVQEGSGIISVEHDGEVYRQYYHNMGRGSHSFVFITPDVAQMAFRQFALVIVVTGAVLVVLGCMVGLYLTRRIYEPVQRVIERLAPYRAGCARRVQAHRVCVRCHGEPPDGGGRDCRRVPPHAPAARSGVAGGRGGWVLFCRVEPRGRACDCATGRRPRWPTGCRKARLSRALLSGGAWADV